MRTYRFLQNVRKLSNDKNALEGAHVCHYNACVHVRKITEIEVRTRATGRGGKR